MKNALFILLLLLPITVLSQSEWYSLELPEQGYKMQFPSVPTASEKTIPSQIGPLLMKMQMLDLSKDKSNTNMLFLTITTAYPKDYEAFKDTSNLPAFYKEAINGAVSNVNGKLLSEEDIFYENYRGKKIKIDYGNGMAIITAHFYLIGYDMYMMQCICETAKDDNKEMDQYFNSFELIEKINIEVMEKEFLGLRTTIYKVSDLNKAREWYEKAFDTKAYFIEDFYVGFSIGGYELGLLPDSKPTVQKTENVIAYWGVKDINESFAKLIENGAITNEKPENVGGEIWTASVKDPWGNVIGIINNPHFKLP